jgi:hypothetical protein
MSAADEAAPEDLASEVRLKALMAVAERRGRALGIDGKSYLVGVMAGAYEAIPREEVDAELRRSGPNAPPLVT